jgi:hypothetical protein
VYTEKEERRAIQAAVNKHSANSSKTNPTSAMRTATSNGHPNSENSSESAKSGLRNHNQGTKPRMYGRQARKEKSRREQQEKNRLEKTQKHKNN